MISPLLTTDPFNFDIFVSSTRLDSARAFAVVKAALGTPPRPHKPRIRPPDGLRTSAEAARKLRCSAKEAAAILGLPMRTVQELAAREARSLGAAKIGRRWTFDLEKLRRFVKHREREAWQNAKRQPDATGAPVLFGAALKSVAGKCDGHFTQVIRRLRARATKRGESG